MILVDTSVWIDHFNGFPSSAAKQLNALIPEPASIGVPDVVLMEILQGLRSDPEARKIEAGLRGFERVPADRGDHIDAAALYRRCRAAGLTIRSPVDCLIAQLSLRHGLDLLAKDRDFKAIARVAPLKLLS